MQAIDYRSLVSINEGAEGQVYQIYGTRVALKLYWSHIRIEQLVIKRKKLLLLKDMPLIGDISTVPHDILLENGILQGFTMEFFEGLNLSEQCCSFEEKVNILNKIKNALLKLYDHGILFLDLRSQNILSDGEEIRLIDIDGAAIQKYSSEVYNNYFNAYQVMGGKEDIHAIIYQFNVLAYQLLTEKRYTTGFRYLLEKHYEDDLESISLNTEGVKTIVEGLFSERCNNEADHEFLTDYIDRKK